MSNMPDDWDPHDSPPTAPQGLPCIYYLPFAIPPLLMILFFVAIGLMK